MANEDMMKRAPSGAVTVRQDLKDELTVGADLAAVAAAEAAAKAETEAGILAARKWRRDIDLVRERIHKDCRRPGLAAIAIYHKPVGRKKDPATGEWRMEYASNFGIRFAEPALQHMGNMRITSRISYDDERRQLLTVQVMDLETNLGYSTDVVLDKVVERKEVKKGRTVLGMRENSYGDTVYLIEATKDEFRNVVGAERSKLIRDNGLRLIPPDILAEARAIIEATLANEAAKDPDSAKKRVLDQFAMNLGISATMLKEYLDRPIETLTAKDLVELGNLYNGLKEGSFTWVDVMRTKTEPAEGETPAASAPVKKASLKERVMSQPSFLSKEEALEKKGPNSES